MIDSDDQDSQGISLSHPGPTVNLQLQQMMADTLRRYNQTLEEQQEQIRRKKLENPNYEIDLIKQRIRQKIQECKAQKAAREQEQMQNKQESPDTDLEQNQSAQPPLTLKPSTSKISPIVVFTCFFVLTTYLVNIRWLALADSNPFEAFLDNYLSKFQLFMVLWAYFQTVFTDNAAPVLKIDRLFSVQYKFCSICRTSKVRRVKHCSSCGQCQARFDHHCVFANNCIGYRNRKAFILFLIYMLLGCSHYLLNFIKFMRTDIILPLLPKVILCYQTLIVIAFACFMLFLALRQFSFLCTAQTTIELIAGKGFQLPLCSSRPAQEQNRGFIKNVSCVFKSYWSSWIPWSIQLQEPEEHQVRSPKCLWRDSLRDQEQSLRRVYEERRAFYQAKMN